MEEIPSEESDALREAYRSLGFEHFGYAEALQGQHSVPGDEAELQQLRSQLGEKAEEQESEAEQAPQKVCHTRWNFCAVKTTLPFCHSSHSLCLLWFVSPYPSVEPKIILPFLFFPQDELIQALNQENSALASRIQELLTHIEVREEEMKKEEAQLNKHITQLQMAKDLLDQESDEQSCLITELTKKTEDDLNTIMELQQELAEVRQHWEELQEQHVTERQGKTGALAAERFLGGTQRDESSSSKKQVQKIKNTSEQLNGSTEVNPCGSSQGSLQNSPTDQLDTLTKSIQSLLSERDELSGVVASLREQQRDVTLSVQTLTEVNQQLTRTVWALKVEKDDVSRHLEGLRRQQEQLAKEVRQLKDEREQCTVGAHGLAAEKEELANALILLKTEKEELLDNKANSKNERDQMMRLVQSLQSERDQLNLQVLSSKQEEEKHTNPLKCVEKKNSKQLSCTLKGDLDKLKKLISTLREEKERLELAVTRLKQEGEQMALHQDQRQAGSRRELPNHSMTTKEETRREGDTTTRVQTDIVQV